MMALIPQEEQIEEDFQMMPPGFNAIVLPYADEVREPKASEGTDVKAEGDM